MLASVFRISAFKPAARALLLLLMLAMTGSIGSIASSLAQAEDVFTDISLPTITGTAVEGKILSETHGVWSTPPTGYVDQWQRCNSSGNKCEGIAKATTQTYRLTAQDVGFTIRVAESASNANGAVTPAVSEPTAVVQALRAGGGGGGGESGGSGNGPPVSCCDKPAHISPTEIKTLLARQLVPAGKATSTSALLKHGGLNMSFSFPEAGSLTVQWLLVPSGAKGAGKTTGEKPILAATGHARFTAAGKIRVGIRLTAQGRKLLRRARKPHIEARGAFAVKGEAAVRVAKRFALSV
jgi:hypothetical protein